jgi:hypothetical protein
VFFRSTTWQFQLLFLTRPGHRQGMEHLPACPNNDNNIASGIVVAHFDLMFYKTILAVEITWLSCITKIF